MQIINMTPHAISLMNAEGTEVIETFPASGNQIRLAMDVVPDEPIGHIPTTRTKFGEPTGLPEYKEGVYYLVSQLTRNALPDRTDLLVPAEVVRDASGQIIGSKSFGR